jgi:predicted Zn finger-like uncharacterized protein
MIVICTGCQARFRVADEKIGPRGAKVRCTRCKNVFVVKLDAPGAPASPAASATPPPAPKIDLDLTPGLARPAPAADPFAPPAGASVIPFPGQAPSQDAGPAVDPFAAAGLETFAPGAAGDDPFVRATGFASEPLPAAPPVADPFSAEADPFTTTGSRNLPVTDLAQLLGAPGSAAAAPPRAPAAAPPPPPPSPPPPSPAMAPFSDLALEEHSGALAGPAPAAPPPFADPADVMSADPGAFPTPGAMFEGGLQGLGEEEPLALATEKTPGPPVLSPARPPPPPPAAGGDEDVEAWAAQFPGGPGPAPTPAPGPAPAAVPAGPPAGGEPPPPASALVSRPARPEEPTSQRVRNAALSALALVAVLVLALATRAVVQGNVPLGPAALRPSTLLRSLGRVPVIGGFELAEVRSSLYPQASGGTVLFVRGVVVSRAPAPVPGVQVEAELVRDGQVLSRGAVLAGAIPSPEEVYRATDRAALDALAAGLRERAPKKVAPGDRLGFLITLGDAPADLSGASVRLQARPEGGAAH